MRARLERIVGLIGDVHAEDAVLERALGHLRGLGAVRILCVGDIADGRGDLDRTIELLDAPGIDCVRGNHDRWALAGEMRALEDAQTPSPRARAFLSALPATRAYETPRGGLLLCHGVGDDDMLELTPETDGYDLQVMEPLRELCQRRDISLMVGGHTHRRMVRSFPGLTVINAGTLRASRTRPRPSVFATVDLAAGALTFWTVEGAITARERCVLSCEP